MSLSSTIVHRCLSLAVIIAVVLPSPSSIAAPVLKRPNRPHPDVAESANGMVVSQTPLASEVGRDILEAGGNAVDASIAVAFALAVTWPEAGNIAGGGFMMVAPVDSDVVCIEYRETAPVAVNADSFVGWANRKHPRMAGVPGTVRGMQLAHIKFGSLPWKDLVSPSVKLARNGFVVDEQLAYSLNAALHKQAGKNSPFQAEFRRVFQPSDPDGWRAGDKLTQPDLAETLEQIATSGADAFYEGPIAEKLVASMKKHDGLITAADLEDYNATLRKPVRGNIAGYDFFGAPLPSSGGTTVLMHLTMLESLGLKRADEELWTTEHLHLISEAMKRGFRERAKWLGDTDYVAIPVRLQQQKFARSLASRINPERATPSKDIAGDIPLTAGPYESMETTHFSVIDADGMGVSNTYTLEARYGCEFIPEGTGMVLNNEMGDFNWHPGYTNLSGAIGTPPNLMAPGKRMLSSQSPTIVKKDGEVRFLVGSPGGRTIINTVTGILTQVLLFDRSLEDAVNAPRFHHQWLPDQIKLEDRDEFSPHIDKLKTMGHEINQPEGWTQGSAQCIAVDPATGVATGVSDRRRGGGARGVKQIPATITP